MRNGLSWLAGFVLFFGIVFAATIVYALDKSSVWLPVSFAIAFGFLLAFASRIGIRARTGLAMVFGTGSSLLWVVSGNRDLTKVQHAAQFAFIVFLILAGLIGLALIASDDCWTGAKEKPSLFPIVLMMATGWLISYFSSAHGGASPMVDWFMRVFGLSERAAGIAVVSLRKTIHFTFYGTVTLAGFAMAFRNGAARRACFVAALATTLAYSTFDEIRQSTQPDRTGSAWDVCLDMSGGSVALIGVAALMRKKRVGGPKMIADGSKL